MLEINVGDLRWRPGLENYGSSIVGPFRSPASGLECIGGVLVTRARKFGQSISGNVDCMQENDSSSHYVGVCPACHLKASYLIDGVEVSIAIEFLQEVAEDDDIEALGIQLVLHNGHVFRRFRYQIQRS